MTVIREAKIHHKEHKEDKKFFDFSLSEFFFLCVLYALCGELFYSAIGSL